MSPHTRAIDVVSHSRKQGQTAFVHRSFDPPFSSSYSLAQTRMCQAASPAYLKKSEGHSGTLPSSEKLLLPKGRAVTLVGGTDPATTKLDGYWLVTCETAGCGL